MLLLIMEGNFSTNNYVFSVIRNRIDTQQLLDSYPLNNPPIILHTESFLNRRLRAGMKEEEKEEIEVVQTRIRTTKRPTLFGTSRASEKPSIYKKPIIIIADEEEDKDE